MQFYKLFGFVISVVHIIPFGRAMEPHNTAELIPATDENFIEIMLHRLGKKHNTPLNIHEIYATLDYSQQRIEVVTDLVVSQHPISSTENLLSLISTVHDVFDAISESTNTLEGSLDGIAGCVDLVVLDVQIALQVLVEAFITNCDISVDAEQRSDGAIVSAAYSLSSAIKALITCMSDLADKIINSTEVFNGQTIIGIQAIVQTILSIVDRVLRTLKYINILDFDSVEPNLDKVSLVINRIANQRFNLIPKMTDELVAPISEYADSLRSTMEEIPKATDKNIEDLVVLLKSIQDMVPDKQLIQTVMSLLNEIHPNLSSLSNAIHSMHGITDSVTYSTDATLQNFMAIKCLFYYITSLTKISSQTQNLISLEDLGSNLQSILCFIASSIQTLIDGVILTIERALTDLICSSPTADKMVLDRQLQELQALIEPVLLTFEHIVRISMQIVQNLLSIGACTLGGIFDTNLMEDMNRLIRNLVRISNEMEATVISKELLSDALPLDDSETTTHENIFSVCIKSFEEVANNANKVRFYFIKTVFDE